MFTPGKVVLASLLIIFSQMTLGDCAPTATDYYLQGEKAYNSGDYFTAAVRWRQVLYVKPDSEYTGKMLPRAINRLFENEKLAVDQFMDGFMMLKDGKVASAAQSFRGALRTKPNAACIADALRYAESLVPKPAVQSTLPKVMQLQVDVEQRAQQLGFRSLDDMWRQHSSTVIQVCDQWLYNKDVQAVLSLNKANRQTMLANAMKVSTAAGKAIDAKQYDSAKRSLLSLLSICDQAIEATKRFIAVTQMTAKEQSALIEQGMSMPSGTYTMDPSGLGRGNPKVQVLEGVQRDVISELESAIRKLPTR